jgi:fatty acid amide hydrolase
MVFNMFNLPSGVLPVTKVQIGEDSYDDNINDFLTKYIKLDIKGSAGLPVGVQVVGYFWEDETVLGVMKAIDDEINFREFPDL